MNLRPLEPHSSALPDCATSRREDVDRRRQQACQQKHPVFLQTAPPAPCAEKGKNASRSARSGLLPGTEGERGLPGRSHAPPRCHTRWMDGGHKAACGISQPIRRQDLPPLAAMCERPSIRLGAVYPPLRLVPATRMVTTRAPGTIWHRTRGKAWAFCPAKQKRDLRFRRSLGVSVFWSG